MHDTMTRRESKPHPVSLHWLWQACLVVAALLLVSLAGTFPAEAEPKFPPLTGRIIDEAGILSSSDVAELTATLRELEGKSSDQIVVYVTRSLQGYEIEDFGYRLGRFWKIGQAPINNGILLIVAGVVILLNL